MQRPKTAILIFLNATLLAFTAQSSSINDIFANINKENLTLSPALQIFILLTFLSLIPSLLIMLSSFTRIVIVLSFLRNALGLQQTPPNSVIISLALFLTLFTMLPVLTASYTKAYLPYHAGEINYKVALRKFSTPFKQFMLKQTREKDLQMILKLARNSQVKHKIEVPILQLIPAFLLSELQTAFQIGFMIFLPFLLVDLIVSGILMTLGMMMMPPMTISLPLKILLFVLIDGWDLVAEALIRSFH